MKASVIASAKAQENSYMLPHGQRDTERPRVRTPPMCSRAPSTVSETAIRPDRSAFSLVPAAPGPSTSSSPRPLVTTVAPSPASAVRVSVVVPPPAEATVTVTFLAPLALASAAATVPARPACSVERTATAPLAPKVHSNM